MTLMQEHINALEKSHKAVLEDVQCLTARNDEFATQQKNLSNTLRKMERNVEDMTDNFHRTQSEFVRSQQNISVTDDAAITKIRSTIFDFQEQHTKFQNQIDSLLQDSKVKSETIDELTEKISHLQVMFADWFFLLYIKYHGFFELLNFWNCFRRFLPENASAHQFFCKYRKDEEKFCKKCLLIIEKMHLKPYITLMQKIHIVNWLSLICLPFVIHITIFVMNFLG